MRMGKILDLVYLGLQVLMSRMYLLQRYKCAKTKTNLGIGISMNKTDYSENLDFI